MLKRLSFKPLVLLCCLLLLGPTNISTAIAAKGGVNGGGANGLEGLFQQTRARLYTMIQNDGNRILENSEQEQLYAEINDGLIQVNFSDSEIGIQTEIRPHSTIIFYPKKLEQIYGPLGTFQILEILAQGYSKHFSNPEKIKTKLLTMIKDNILIPYFFNIPQAMFLSDSTESGCRDKMNITTNPFTGELYLRGSSSEKCSSKDWPKNENSQLDEEKIKSPSIKYECTKSDEENIFCKASMDEANEFCMRVVLNNKTIDANWSTLKISSSGVIRAHYYWCNIVENKIYKRYLDKTYFLKKVDK